MFRKRRARQREEETAPGPGAEGLEEGLDADLDDGGGADDGDDDAETGDGLEDRPERPDGPYDVDELPQDGVARLDLGGMLVPVLDDVEIRVEVDQQGTVVAATAVTGPSLVQLGAFAAPRSSGIWSEVRTEIRTSLTAGGGTATEVQGPYGVELLAEIPTEQPGVRAPARFIGIDGPRWFLRALVQGQGAAGDAADPQVMEVVRRVVVVRGGDAMAVRDPLPLRLPADTPPPAGGGRPAEEGSSDARAADGAEVGDPGDGADVEDRAG